MRFRKLLPYALGAGVAGMALILGGDSCRNMPPREGAYEQFRPYTPAGQPTTLVGALEGLREALVENEKIRADFDAWYKREGRYIGSGRR